MEHQLQQEQHRCCVLQHSLDDKIAELDLERVEKEVSSGTNDLIYVAVQKFDDALYIWGCLGKR